jgi:ABC-2 type transport system permease protein
MTTLATPVGLRRSARSAPLDRLLRAELRWIFRRPRTLIAIGAVSLIPILIAVGVKVSSGPGGGIFGALVSNGLALPVVSLTVLVVLFLPLVGAMSAADAIAGEVAAGTLRGLLIAPVGRVKLLGVKAFGVAAVALAATLAVSLVGVVIGLALLGSGGLVTLSGTTIGVGPALLRVLIAALWVAFQVFAVSAVALAISTLTEHPMVVMAATLAGLIVMQVLGSVPSLGWLHPYLISNDWPSVVDVLRDPIPSGDLTHGLAVAACYMVIGLAGAVARMVTKDG